jgi:1,4-dihydroxy-6-naphthoate synthase
MIEITLGHTPDADDAFMFYGLASENVESSDFHITHVIEDIEKLNKRALNNELDITAISVYAYAFLKDYVILRSGGSFGINYGPILLAKEKFLKDDLNKKIIAIPGRMTSSYLLLSILLGNFKEKELPFHTIPQAIIDNQVDAGLVIHEIQLTYKSLNLHKIIDLGSWWHKLTNGLPVPLGINVANNKTLTLEQIRRFDSVFKNSIIYGLNNIEEALDYAMKYGRGQSKDMISKFVKMYVNEITVDMGEKGKTSIERIFQLASERNIISPFQIDFA